MTIDQMVRVDVPAVYNAIRSLFEPLRECAFLVLALDYNIVFCLSDCECFLLMEVFLECGNKFSFKIFDRCEDFFAEQVED